MRGGGGARSSGPWDKGGAVSKKIFFQPFRPQFGLKIRGYQGPSLDPSLVCELWWVDLRTKQSRWSVEEDCSKNNLPSIARNVKSHCLVFMFKMSVSHFQVYRICNINSKALILCGVSSCCENYCWFTFVFGTWVLFLVFFNLLYYIWWLHPTATSKNYQFVAHQHISFWLVSEKHRLTGNRIIINKSANSLTVHENQW